MSERLFPEIVDVSASGLSEWQRCRRAFRNRYLLGIPPSDTGNATDIGNRVHGMLRRIHEDGSCSDQEIVAEVLTLHGENVGGAIHSFIERHQRRCPQKFEWQAHEYEAARLHRIPGPPFIAAGKLDAVWIHTGLLDSRDYKTGKLGVRRVGDDLRARLQAWLVGARALHKDLQIHVRYEYLAAEIEDDPEPYEPGEAELEATGEEIRAIVADMRATRDWKGVSDPEICGMCSFRSVCPDSAAPAEATWPAASLH